MTDLSKGEYIELLSEVARDGFLGAHDKGNEWLRSDFLPALDLAQQHLKGGNLLIAKCFYTLGGIHEFNDAPKAAIKAYELSIKWFEGMAEAYADPGSNA